MELQFLPTKPPNIPCEIRPTHATCISQRPAQFRTLDFAAQIAENLTTGSQRTPFEAHCVQAKETSCLRHGSFDVFFESI